FLYLSIAPVPMYKANDAYTAGMMAGLTSLPGALAIGASAEGERFVARAVTIGGAKTKSTGIAGLFSSMFSDQSSGQPIAASFAPADTDVFVDLMIDWDRLYDSIGSLFGAVAGSMGGGGSAAPAQSADLIGALEAKLGFSIKNDLIPTLGNEI